MNANIPKSYINGVTETLQQEDVPADIDLTRISSALDSSASELVDFQVFSDAISLLAEHIPHPGLSLARHIPLTAHGPLSACIMSADNIEQIFEVLKTYTESRVPILSLQVEKKGDFTELVYVPKSNALPFWDLLQECIFSTIYYNMEFLFEDPIFPATVDFTQPAPQTGSAFKYFDQTRLSFGNDYFSISFSNALLDKKSRFSNPELYAMSRGLCDELLDQSSLQLTFSEKVYRTLIQSDELLSVDCVAKSLSLSERSLRNKLKQEDSNFQKINRQAKLDRAVELLATSNLSIQAISEKMGYQDVASFSTAFKKWSGSSPLHIRQNK